MNKKYIKEFLIDELHRFVRENGRVPTGANLTIDSGYPTIGTYQYYFKTFNNALETARLKFNKYKPILDGTETCSYCGKRADEIDGFRAWTYLDNIRYCEKHGHAGAPNYVKKELNPKSTTGKAIVSQRVVANVLGLSLENDCNCSVGFGAKYDLYDEGRYNYINVKDSQLYYRQRQNPYWNYNLTQKEIPDTYILVGFDEERKNILKVWITDAVDDLVYDEKNGRPKKSILITNTYKTLTKAKPWEVDSKPYDDMLHKMSEKRKDTNGENCILDSRDLNE